MSIRSNEVCGFFQDLYAYLTIIPSFFYSTYDFIRKICNCIRDPYGTIGMAFEERPRFCQRILDGAYEFIVKIQTCAQRTKEFFQRNVYPPIMTVVEVFQEDVLPVVIEEFPRICQRMLDGAYTTIEFLQHHVYPSITTVLPYVFMAMCELISILIPVVVKIARVLWQVCFAVVHFIAILVLSALAMIVGIVARMVGSRAFERANKFVYYLFASFITTHIRSGNVDFTNNDADPTPASIHMDEPAVGMPFSFIPTMPRTIIPMGRPVEPSTIPGSGPAATR